MILYYASDADVIADFELQGWIGDVHHQGFVQNANVVQSKFETIEDLAELVTAILYQGSVGHAMQGDPMFNTYANTVFNPLGINKEAPKKVNIL